MNERIKDCWLKAAREDSDDKWDTQVEFIERFARLIIQECLDIVEGEDDLGPDTKSVRLAMKRMKQHFGIKL